MIAHTYPERALGSQNKLVSAAGHQVMHAVLGGWSRPSRAVRVAIVFRRSVRLRKVFAGLREPFAQFLEIRRLGGDAILHRLVQVLQSLRLRLGLHLGRDLFVHLRTRESRHHLCGAIDLRRQVLLFSVLHCSQVRLRGGYGCARERNLSICIQYITLEAGNKINNDKVRASRQNIPSSNRVVQNRQSMMRSSVLASHGNRYPA